LPEFAKPVKGKDGRDILADGEPDTHTLRRYECYPSSMITTANINCCECGFAHIYRYEVFRTAKGDWGLAVMPHGINATRLGQRGLKIVKRKPKKRVGGY